jgi:EAL domain-containing protein (putative c-di-GMP-specific phosphodiesterase class I)
VREAAGQGGWNRQAPPVAAFGVEHLKNVVGHYRERGFRVALDDMGSGYSSLNMIHRLRPDFIKLDMQLIRGVFDGPYKAIIARKVLEMAQELGVQTQEEMNWAQIKARR